MYSVKPYMPPLKEEWDAFVRCARNGVFLFERGYMDYHAQCFADASLLLYDDAELVALLPAHRSGSEVVSHGGLSFGGLVLHPRSGAQDVLKMFDALIPALRAQGATQLRYRPVPHLYHRQPSEDDLYALHRLGARTLRMDLSTSVDLTHRPALAKGRRHALAKARRAAVQVRCSTDYAPFWALLQQVLDERHGVPPTHSLDEIRGLAARFTQIRFYGAYAEGGEGELLAGAVLYDYDRVAHTQYLAASAAGREVGALDAVIAHLLDEASEQRRWFSFGVSSHEQGRLLNTGLLAQKEMFGGRSTVLQTLVLDLATGERHARAA
jgi:Acetyltransferase (GNAT) domain